MLTRLLIGVSILLTILAASVAPKLINVPTESVIADIETTSPPVSVSHLDRVEVQQQIVRAVEATEARRAERPAPTVIRKTIRRESQAAPVTFIQRAARTLVGDGRHRPEPFPRAR
jgi:hypothetical protein